MDGKKVFFPKLCQNKGLDELVLEIVQIFFMLLGQIFHILPLAAGQIEAEIGNFFEGSCLHVKSVLVKANPGNLKLSFSLQRERLIQASF